MRPIHSRNITIHLTLSIILITLTTQPDNLQHVEKVSAAYRTQSAWPQHIRACHRLKIRESWSDPSSRFLPAITSKQNKRWSLNHGIYLQGHANINVKHWLATENSFLETGNFMWQPYWNCTKKEFKHGIVTYLDEKVGHILALVTLKLDDLP